MSKRTDSHSPANLVTEDYDYILAADNQAAWVLHGGDYALEASRNLARTDRLDRGTHQCHHCGAHIRYFAILKHIPTGDYIAVGETCLDNRFERSSADFHKVRKAAELDRQAQRIKKAVAAFVEANPDLAFMADKNHEHTNGFIADVARKLRNYGELSERQVEAVRKAVVRDAQWAAEREAKAAAEALEVKITVPEGRYEIEGEVVSLKWQENDFGGSLKMLVKDPRGFKVWGTCPSALDCQKGDTVRFTATVTKSDKDDSFGFFKVPKKAVITATKEEEA